MSDVLLVVITIAFFGLCVLLVRACDSIIGPDDDGLLDEPDSAGDVSGSSESSTSTDGEEVLTGAAS